jgi:hypothetical protein
VIGGLALALIALYGVDTCWANMARVQVPSALLATSLAASGVTQAFGRLRAIPARAALAAAVAATIVPTAIALYQPTNEQAEEDFIRAAVAELPRGEFTLVRVGWEDRDRDADALGGTHHHFPDYLLAADGRRGTPRTVAAWVRRPDWRSPAYFFAGVRCFARFRGEEPVPSGDNLQPGCARMRQEFVLEPVLEWEVPNRGDVWINYYGDAPTLTLGLYRIVSWRHEAS